MAISVVNFVTFGDVIVEEVSPLRRETVEAAEALELGDVITTDGAILLSTSTADIFGIVVDTAAISTTAVVVAYDAVAVTDNLNFGTASDAAGIAALKTKGIKCQAIEGLNDLL